LRTYYYTRLKAYRKISTGKLKYKTTAYRKISIGNIIYKNTVIVKLAYVTTSIKQ